VDVFIDGKLLAKGEVTVDNNRICVRIGTLYSSAEKFKHL
jgi:flagellar motor switch/type III secretory pathway protein FliN